MWISVLWSGVSISAWCPPKDLWDVFATSPAPSDKHVLASLAEDAPYRWFLPA